ncbi:MAG: substrate-binding domain-containing protein [Formivibrio sp.]|nr:substrate-binding domain-containing protein [Formivibrio sp.]
MPEELATSGKKLVKHHWLRKLAWLFVYIALPCAIACHDRRIAIAVIPRTTATPIWEAEHLGIQAVTQDTNVHIYWNAPTREDDVEGQIALIEQVMNRHYNGLILAPDNASALLAPVRHILRQGTPVVVIGSPLLLSSSGNLCYLLNDEETGGRLAAQRLALILHGRGNIAILGINPDVIGIVDRTRTLASVLRKESPNIHIIEERAGTFDEDHERQAANEFLDQRRDVDAIITLSSATTHGLLEAMRERNINTSKLKIIAFDRDDDERLLFDTPRIDSVVIEDTGQMGAEAARQILQKLHGQPMCSTRCFQPLLVTRENLHQQMSQLHPM